MPLPNLRSSSKLQKTIITALFVSFASQIRFHFLTEGFIVALSVLIMAIFIYCFEDLSAMYIATLSGIFSPMLRFTTEYLQNEDLSLTIHAVLPDVFFFLAYGAIYTLFYRYVFRSPRNMRNFAITAFFADLLANCCELSVRSIMSTSMLLTSSNIAFLMLIALCRTGILMMVVVSIESYSRFLVDKEHEDEYKRLLLTASMIEGEMHIMEKNKAEVEAVMKKAYTLYNKMKDTGYPEEDVSQALAIARNTHEIKGDYQNVLSVLHEVYLRGLENNSLTLDELITLERTNVQSQFRSRGADITITYRGNMPYHTRKSFRMMSIIRNLLTNAAEALEQGPGKIRITAEQKNGNVIIHVRDNGPGISEEDQETIFLDGYSTKFDESGNIMRGLGLSVVKDYVTTDYNGTISIDSEVGQYTDFCLTMPKEKVLEDENAILRS